jgi:hypothetical protein
MYGFDSIFDFNLRSYTDLVINSDRGNMNNNRLATNWRPLWQNMFKDFNGTGKEHKCEFVLHHMHDNLKFKIGDNVVIEKYGKRGEIPAPNKKLDDPGWQPPVDGIM